MISAQRSQQYYNQDVYYHPTIQQSSGAVGSAAPIGRTTHQQPTITTTTVTSSTVASRRTVNDKKMAVVPGRQARACLDIFAFVLCIAFVVIQLALIDYYYLTVLNDNMWYAWIAADVLVIVILIWITALAMRTNQQEMEEMCTAGMFEHD